ncbi:aminopeptidase [Butyrivibrio sp. M55]|uniref:aminopeptidase n=1 Tax=Butyrivibrio sp. M55 TaxID=1855323 RepID=UPI0008E56638|nr:aminopeptidase [Butyrivibrio sp. M55]SFU76704.1 Aspartyl aminopeptidase [Butyrivibrio sp. M55]
MNKKNVWTTYNRTQLKECDKFAEKYKKFLDNSKTEREAIDTIVNEIEAEGYRELNKLVKENTKLKKGDKVYSVWMNKSIVMFKIGSEPLEKGLNILGAHIDSPRLDVKQNPLYEDNGLAYLDTHYYGGIKKYQFVTIPLALHGVVAKKDGTTVILNVGEDEDDPVFFISDILVHLASEQMGKKASSVIEGEALDLVIGNRPFVIEGKEKSEDKKDDSKLTEGEQYAVKAEKEEKAEAGKLSGAVRRGIVALLYDLYGIEEEDFLSAELEIVPAGKSRDAGFDRSMVLGYGHDDRVCAYPSAVALLEAGDLKRTGCCILVDKEEIGSAGATGMKSRFFENAVAEIVALVNGKYDELVFRRCLANSSMLSSDVSAAFDPCYASVFEKKNTAYLGFGPVFNKYTGSRGKYASNDANAEYIAAVRKVYDDANVLFQTAELGKVDAGGGGTIAYILAEYGMNVIDSGVAVLNMHSPCEVISKADLYESLRGYIAFLENMDFCNE